MGSSILSVVFINNFHSYVVWETLAAVRLDGNGLVLLAAARDVRLVAELAGGNVLEVLGRHDGVCWWV